MATNRIYASDRGAQLSESSQRERAYRSLARTAFDTSPSSCKPLFSKEKEFYEFLDAVDLLIGRMQDFKRGSRRSLSRCALEDEFLSLALRMDSFAFATYDHHRFKPDIARILEVFRSSELALRRAAYGGWGRARCRQIVSERFSACQEILNTGAAADARKGYKQRQQENATSCKKYFDALLRKHPRQFVFRVDVYAPIRDRWWQLEDILNAEAGIDTLLMRLRKGQIVDNLLGYAVVRESGYCRGLHYSLIAIQNGYVPRDGYQAAEAVGAEWMRCFQKSDEGFLSKTNYLNIYSLHEAGMLNGLGYVEASNSQARSALDAAVEGMWDVPVMFDAKRIEGNLAKNPAGNLDGIAVRNLRKGKM